MRRKSVGGKEEGRGTGGREMFRRQEVVREVGRGCEGGWSWV